MSGVTLADALGTVPLATIREHLESRTVFHAPSPGIALARLFTLADLERLLATGLSADDDLRITLKGTPVDLAKLGAIDAKGRTRPLVLQKLLRQGASVIVNNAQRRVPHLHGLAADVEATTGARCTIGIIASFSEMVALPVHYDRQDLILIQLDGAKSWRFLGHPVTGSGMRPLPGAALPNDVVHTVDLRRGDLMFVPSGQHHQCTSDGWSMHMGILLHHPSGLDLLEDLFAQNRDLAIPFPAFEGEAARANRQRAFKETLTAAIRDADIDDWLARWSANAAKPASIALRPVDLDTPGATASLIVRPAQRADGKWEASGSVFTLGEQAVATLAQLPCAVAGLHDKTGLKQLLKEGIARID
ncbi:JmjC domain-containing protein [Sphingomonas sp. LT1P40]|uniref:JmjC domain-containing protein n=1 Tax=Alteristakelama amylovorans TaxID=3096166 RepID=UPI002FC9B8C4